MNYKLSPGDTAEITQADGETLTIRAYDDFTMLKAVSIWTTLKTENDSHFIMAVRVVENEPVKQVRFRANDDVVEFMRSRFPDRIGTAKIMDFHEIAVLGVTIDIDGLTHSELMIAGMSYDESVHLLGQ